MKVWQGLSMLLMVSMLSACGGGGGGGGGGSGDAASHVQEALPPSAVQLSPASLGGNQSAGSSQTWTVQASVSDPSRFNSTIYLYVVDSQQVLAGTPQLNWLGGNQMALTLHTSGTLATGHYKGTLQFQLCRDPQCGSSFLSGPLTLPYDFSVAAQPLQAVLSGVPSSTAVIGQRSNFSSSVSVSGLSGKWTAKASSNWLLLSNAAGQGAGSFNVSMSTERLAAGSYSDNVIVTSDDGQTVTLPFSVNVRPVQFVASQDSFSFSGINGSELPGQILQLSLNNNGEGAWTASSNAAWLQAGAVSGITPSSIPLSADPSRGALASGNYNGTLHLSAAGVENKDIAASLSLTKASFTLPAQGIVLGGDKGRDLVTPQSLQFALNTGNKSWPWKVASQPAWLKTGAANGSVNQTAQALSLNGDFSQATVGSTTAALKLSAQINGDAVEGIVPVTINRDQRRLLPSKWGVAFSSTPAGKVLSKTLTIKDNFGGTLNWTATSDALWLSVTASGQTGNGSTLQLLADDSRLPIGKVSYANVTIRSSASYVEPAIVKVAVWRDESFLKTTTVVSGQYSKLVADPIRPYFYTNMGEKDVQVFNAYTASQVATIRDVASAAGEMAVSPDGSFLYVVDLENKKLVVIDLIRQTKVDVWEMPKDDWGDPLKVHMGIAVVSLRVNGAEIVLLGNGASWKNGKSLGLWSYGNYSKLQATDDGGRVYSYANNWVQAFDVDFSEVGGGTFFSDKNGHLLDFVTRNGLLVTYNDFSALGDGSSVMVTGITAQQSCMRYDAKSLSYLDSLVDMASFANSVLVLGDARVICAWSHAPNVSISGSQPDMVSLYSRDGVPLANLPIPGYGDMVARSWVALGDSSIVGFLNSHFLYDGGKVANSLVIFPIGLDGPQVKGN